MKFFLSCLLLVCLAVAVCGQIDDDDEDTTKVDSWWSRFKGKVKTVLSKWREDLKVLWDDVLAKADDMKGWTSDMFDSLKRKLREFLEKQPEVPDEEKNEIENLISRLKVSTEKPFVKPGYIDP